MPQLQGVPDGFICPTLVKVAKLLQVVSAGERNNHAKEQEHQKEHGNGRHDGDLQHVR